MSVLVHLFNVSNCCLFHVRSISIASPWQRRTAPSWSPSCRAVRKRMTMKGKNPSSVETKWRKLIKLCVLVHSFVISCCTGSDKPCLSLETITLNSPLLQQWEQHVLFLWTSVWYQSPPSCPLILLLCSCLCSQRRLRDFRPPAFSYSVSILDLDPKPFDSIPRQLRLDQKIVSCYLKTGGALPKGSLTPYPGIFAAAEREDCTLLFHPMWTPGLAADRRGLTDAASYGEEMNQLFVLLQHFLFVLMGVGSGCCSATKKCQATFIRYVTQEHLCCHGNPTSCSSHEENANIMYLLENLTGSPVVFFWWQRPGINVLNGCTWLSWQHALTLLVHHGNASEAWKREERK